jgi:hypothetical protein
MAPLRTFSRTPVLWLDNLAEVSIHGQPIVLCHYALRVWNRFVSIESGNNGFLGQSRCKRLIHMVL